MKVFVTGGAGYIGSVCTEELINADHEVAVFDNLSEGHRAAIQPAAKFYQGDLAELKALEAALAETKPDAVMYFAGSILVGESMSDPIKYFRNNVITGINLLDAMVKTGVKKIIFSSTAATYGMPLTNSLNEESQQKPINPYGESKLIFEKMLPWVFQPYGITHVNLRYFNAAGASEKYGEDHRIETHLIPNIIKVALGKTESVKIFGTDYETPDGTCIRDYIHVRDLAAAHILALSCKENKSYNLGSGNGYSVQQVIDTVRKVTGHPIPVEENPRREGDPAVLVANSDKIRRELGWKPQFDNLKMIVESAWRWHQAHPNGYG